MSQKLAFPTVFHLTFCETFKRYELSPIPSFGFGSPISFLKLLAKSEAGNNRQFSLSSILGNL